jgi:signal transduction histidine kinase
MRNEHNANIGHHPAIDDWIDAVARVAGISLIVLDARLCLIHVNESAAGMLGLGAPERRAERWKIVVPQLQPQRWSQRAGQAMPYRFNVAVAEHIVRFEVYDYEPERAYLVFLKQLEDNADRQLLVAAKARNRQYLLPSLAHELNGPLNAMKIAGALFARTLQSENLSGQASERCARYLGVFEAEITRLQSVASHIPDVYGDIESANEVEPVDLRMVVEEVMRLLEYSLRVRRIELHLTLSEFPVVVTIRQHRLREAVLRVVIHALEHMPHGAALTASVQRATGQGQIAIEYPGPPLAPEEVERTFQLYAPRQGDMDLYLTRLVAESQSGDLRVERAHGGVRFVIGLPLPQEGVG